MAAKLNLDLTKTQAESSSIFSRVPAGTYTVVLAHSQFKDTSSGGAGLQLGFMIEEGEHTGKMVQDFVNIVNSNEDAQRIGLGRIKRIMEVQNRKDFKLTTDEALISSNKFQIEVEIEQGVYKDKPAENNRVKKILALEGSSQPTTTAKKEVKKESVQSPQTEEKMPWDLD